MTQTATDNLHRYLDLIELIRHGRFDEFLVTTSEDEVLDWWAFYEFLHEHRLREYFYSMVHDNSRLAMIPSEVSQKLSRYMEHSRKRRARLSVILSEASDCLDAAGISSIQLKGQLLTMQCYPGADYRHQGDVDLMVKEADAKVAYSALLDSGFEPKRGRLRLSQSRLRAEHGTVVLRDQLSLDLHWALRRGPNYRFQEETIWKEAESCQIEGVERKVLSEESTFLLSLLSLVHDLGRGGVRAKALVDLCYLIDHHQENLCSKNFWRRCDAQSISSLCRHALVVIDTIFTESGHRESWEPFVVEEEYEKLIETQKLSWKLCAASRGDMESWLWYARVNELWKSHQLIWLLSQHLPRIGRFPLFAVRIGRLCWHLTRRSFLSLKS